MLIAFLVLLGIPLGALAGDFDGSKPLLCAVKKAFECTAADGCQERTVESVNIPQFLQIDVEQKKLKALLKQVEKERKDFENEKKWAKRDREEAERINKDVKRELKRVDERESELRKNMPCTSGYMQTLEKIESKTR